MLDKTKFITVMCSRTINTEERWMNKNIITIEIQKFFMSFYCIFIFNHQSKTQ